MHTGPENVPSLINLTELFCTTKKSRLKLYVMHLLEFTERSSTIPMVQKARKNGLPFTHRFRRGMSHDQIVAAFEAYSQHGRVSIRHSTAISALSNIHKEIFHVTEEKRVGMIILPFQKQWRGEGEETVDSVCHGWREVNLTMLRRAPCSLAVLVDRGFGNGSDRMMAETAAAVLKRVCIVFFGGPDDQKVLELGRRMAENAAIKVCLVRFIGKARAGTSSTNEQTKSETCTENGNSFYTEVDDAVAEDFKSMGNGTEEYEEKTIRNIKNELLMIRRSREYELFVGGKERLPSIIEANTFRPSRQKCGFGTDRKYIGFIRPWNFGFHTSRPTTN